MPTIKELVVDRYGSINTFIEKNYDKMKTSRTHMYKLINNESSNPTVATMVELAELLGIPKEDVFNEYSSRYRNEQPKD